MPNTPDPRRFFAATKLLLMPSLMENAALVAIEAMFNGIPVLASARGGLPETIGGSPHPNPLPEGEGTGGFLFDIPARYTPETRDVPTAEEVAPWAETIIRLWDDAAEYDRASRAALERAQAWHPDRLAPLYRNFFSRVSRRPEPPPVSCCAAG
jgi:glycosyltransferase involved in cell wall biosynthesis